MANAQAVIDAPGATPGDQGQVNIVLEDPTNSRTKCTIQIHKPPMDPQYLVPHYSFGPIHTRSISNTRAGYQAVGVLSVYLRMVPHIYIYIYIYELWCLLWFVECNGVYYGLVSVITMASEG